MNIHLRLHGRLRDKLPAVQKGRVVLVLPEGVTAAEVLAAVGLQDEYVLLAINEAHESELSQSLQEGDRVEVFLPSAGG